MSSRAGPAPQAAEAVEQVHLAGFIQLEAHGMPPSSKYRIHDYYYIMPGNICIAIKNTFDTPIIYNSEKFNRRS
jgi:hypothetical protein